VTAPTPVAPGTPRPGREAEGTAPAQAELPLLGSAPAEPAMTAPNRNSGALAYVHSIVPDAINRAPDDFYPTPPEGTWALLSAIRFKGNIWEPACGDGSMSRVLEAAGYEVISTDLIDRGYGTSPVDFLLDYRTKADNIVTNPPFKLVDEFARHALDRAADKVALLARLAWLEGYGRRKFFENSPLWRVYVFSRRLRIQRGRAAVATDRSGMVPFAWFVWQRGYHGHPQVGWLDPKIEGQQRDHDRRALRDDRTGAAGSQRRKA
jgi:hypothetical protein